MSRQIKFRVWIGVDRKMCYDFRINAKTGNYCWVSNNGTWNNCDKYPVMQFTGLKDSKGREVYEGDVVVWDGEHDTEWIGTVEYVAPSFEISWFKTPYPVANTRLDSRVRVLGNKFENAEEV